ncbi:MULTISPECIES: DUF4307 domain-containing protein [unclassified Microbacterium]|uniref:DUF4307 domain-containing protein n=1 Tax=unclassified Microbacterium TaxID=2609290 RepID=UPI001D1F4514|nr:MULTISPECIES: DUF4307 domain-containing protein [unclassified Microbacterium]CAH0140915.1 hypothetical protein SRABI128_00300 [Microbacterium sp. Bi128]
MNERALTMRGGGRRAASQRTALQTKLDDRYGRTSRPWRRRVFWIGVTVFAAAAIAYLVWITLRNSLDDISIAETGYLVVDERAVAVSFQATPPSGVRFACAIQALDEDFGVVGWRVVEYDPFPETTRSFTERVPTLALATTGTVKECWTI